MVDNTLVHNLVTDEYWMGPLGVPKATDLVLERSRGGSLLEEIDGFLSASDDSAFSLHIGSALHWSYRADSSETLVDRFLMRWIALEMLLCGPDDDASDLIRRLPFTFISVGGRRASIRRELERRWVPLRNDIVHRAVQEHASLAEGAVRVKYFADRSIAYALAGRHEFQSLQAWLAHLDDLARKRPRRPNQ